VELSTEKAKSKSAISIDWVRPHPQFYPRYFNRKCINSDEKYNLLRKTGGDEK